MSPVCSGRHMSEDPLSLPDYLAFLGTGFAVDGHRPWPRFVLDEEGWRALVARLATADWSLLGLWGESDTIHLALHDEADGAVAVASLGCSDGRFPSIGAVRPGAIRLERTIFDLFGHVPIGSLDGRPWLDHGNWPVAHPLAARPSERATPSDHYAGTIPSCTRSPSDPYMPGSSNPDISAFTLMAKRSPALRRGSATFTRASSG